jgi:hypothetical protein
MTQPLVDIPDDLHCGFRCYHGYSCCAASPVLLAVHDVQPLCVEPDVDSGWQLQVLPARKHLRWTQREAGTCQQTAVKNIRREATA